MVQILAGIIALMIIASVPIAFAFVARRAFKSTSPARVAAIAAGLFGALITAPSLPKALKAEDSVAALIAVIGQGAVLSGVAFMIALFFSGRLKSKSANKNDN